MKNPFESGQIKNYLALYAAVVVIMILFFMASTLFNEIEDVDKKVFNTTPMESTTQTLQKEANLTKPKFKLLERAY
jgi:hypothetical protein